MLKREMGLSWGRVKDSSKIVKVNHISSLFPSF